MVRAHKEFSSLTLREVVMSMLKENSEPFSRVSVSRWPLHWRYSSLQWPTMIAIVDGLTLRDVVASMSDVYFGAVYDGDGPSATFSVHSILLSSRRAQCDVFHGSLSSDRKGFRGYSFVA